MAKKNSSRLLTCRACSLSGAFRLIFVFDFLYFHSLSPVSSKIIFRQIDTGIGNFAKFRRTPNSLQERPFGTIEEFESKNSVSSASHKKSFYQILFSFSTDKDRRTDSRVRRKNTAQPRRESNPSEFTKVSLLGVDLHVRHAQKQGREVLSTFMNDRKSRKIPRCKTALTFETRAQIMLVPHCACVSYNSSGYLDTCKRFALTRVPSTRISRIPCYPYTCKRSLNPSPLLRTPSALLPPT